MVTVHLTYPPPTSTLESTRSLSDDWMIVTLEPLQFVRLGRSPFESTVTMEGMITLVKRNLDLLRLSDHLSGADFSHWNHYQKRGVWLIGWHKTYFIFVFVFIPIVKLQYCGSKTFHPKFLKFQGISPRSIPFTCDIWFSQLPDLDLWPKMSRSSLRSCDSNMLQQNFQCFKDHLWMYQKCIDYVRINGNILKPSINIWWQYHSEIT